MTEPFTILEEQFVRASLITKTDEEIAEKGGEGEGGG
jgi:hypothetical protein